ncbi:MAG: glycosyl hydrolase 115 family protein [Butyrivibrio sp.]|nr:glycosyl hydrolase 115 family protein [Butyrivibrio sp.]
MVMLNCNTQIVRNQSREPVEYAVKALLRDIQNTCNTTNEEGTAIVLENADDIPVECFELQASDEMLTLRASDDLGFIYGIYYISKHFLKVNEFWFWNEQIFEKKDGYKIPDDFYYRSEPYNVRFRGWFVNDEVLIDDWKINGDNELPWEMTFEALLRCGGNMTIPGTDHNAHIYCEMASQMGLWITHHHAEPLGAQMFSRAYPDLEASYDKYPELFEKLWREGIEKQKNYKVLWNLGFRGQGDRPFWADDPAYDTDEKRGRLMSQLIRKQYDLIKSYDKDAICCSNLYGETMELYKKGFLDIPEDVIFIWADNGFGKMVSRRQGRHNPRVYALPEAGAGGKHGIYYHASFYDLQAAAQMTMLPNSPEFVVNELKTVYDAKANDYWIINCSNVKPHAYILGLIAKIWNSDFVIDNVEEYVSSYLHEYCCTYYGDEYADKISEMYRLWPQYCPKYGPNEDDHAGEQFTNHGARVLTTAFITGFNKKAPSETEAAKEWLWFSDKQTLIEQVADYKKIIETAKDGYEQYLSKCYEVAASLPASVRKLFVDTLVWQVEYHYYSYLGALHTCNAIETAILDKSDDQGMFLKAFYEAGLAAKAFKTGYEKMRSTENGAFEGFFANDCEADIRQSYYVLLGLMSYLRFHGDGPHFYKWQRMFQAGAGGNKVLLILRVKKHLTDEELWEIMDEAGFARM